MRGLDLHYFDGTGMTSEGFGESPLFYSELGRIIDEDRQDAIADEVAGCADERCDDGSTRSRYGRELTAVLLPEREPGASDDALVNAMSEEAQALAEICR